LVNFDVTEAHEMQYRPFKDAKYHLNMGLMKMPQESWIELDSTYKQKMALKRQLLTEKREILTAFAPEGWEASYEALELQVAFLVQRFPRQFSRTDVGIRNHILDEAWDLRRKSELWQKRHPTEIMGMLTLDDYVIVVPDTAARGLSQEYRVRAGTVCFPGGWKVPDKLNLSIFELHAGKVPGYESKIALSMNRFFARMKVEEPVQRFNYHIDPSPDLCHPKSHHNVEDGPATLNELHFRVERQCLRRLPRTRGVIFQIRTYLYPLSEIFGDELGAHTLQKPSAALNEETAVRWRRSIDHLEGQMARYKNKGVWEEAVIKALEEWFAKNSVPLEKVKGDQVV
jgi:dimethylamine monooxygenase subunit A